jgi:hypothetical protein
MFDQLSSLAIGLVIFAIVITVGIVVLVGIRDSQASCTTGSFTTYNATAGVCYNSTGSAGSAPANAAWTNPNTLSGYLGTSSGGLASWTLAIIALAVGMLFIGALMNKRKY